MSLLPKLATDALETSSHIFNQGILKTKEWAGHSVRYIQKISTYFAENPNAAVGVIVVANTVFLFAMNRIVRAIEKGFANNDGKPTRNWKQVCVGDPLFAGSVVGLNYGLSRLTQGNLHPLFFLTMAVTSLALRYFYNLQEQKKQQATRSKPAQPQATHSVTTTQPKETTQTPAVDPSVIAQKDKKIKALEERIDALTKQAATPVQPKEPEKQPTSRSPSPRNIDVLTLRKEIADLKKELGDQGSKIAGLELNLAQNDATIQSLEDDKKTLAGDKQKIQQQIDDLQQQHTSLSKDKAALDLKIKQLEQEREAAVKEEGVAKHNLKEKETEFDQKLEELRLEKAQQSKSNGQEQERYLAEIKDLKAEKTRLVGVESALNKQLGLLHVSLAAIEQEIKAADQKTKELSQKLEASNKANEHLIAEKAKLLGIETSLNQRIEELNANLAQIQKEKGAADQQNQSLSQRLEGANRANEQLQSELNRATASSQENQEKVAALGQLNKKLQAAIVEKEAQDGRIQDELTALNAAKSAKENELKASKEEVQSLYSELSQAKRALEELGRNIARTQQEKQKMHEAHEEALIAKKREFDSERSLKEEAQRQVKAGETKIEDLTREKQVAYEARDTFRSKSEQLERENGELKKQFEDLKLRELKTARELENVQRELALSRQGGVVQQLVEQQQPKPETDPTVNFTTPAKSVGSHLKQDKTDSPFGF